MRCRRRPAVHSFAPRNFDYRPEAHALRWAISAICLIGSLLRLDARRFEYIGIPTQDNVACAFTKASGITTFDALRNSKTPVKVGGVAPGDTTYNTAKLLLAALKLPIQLVAGYKGTAEVRLAAEAGEVAGGCWQWESIKSIWRQGLDSGNVSTAW